MKNKEYKLIDQDLGFEEQQVSEWAERQAARCILKREDKIAMLFLEKFGYHKVPGGGIEEGEKVKQALEREVKEEIGSKIHIEKEIARLTSLKTQQGTKQTSIFFLATEKESGEPEYTEKEKKEGYKPEWYTLEESIKVLEKEDPSHYIAQFINARDLKILKEVKNSIGIEE
jgi:ADP-ribose pyrophosphatase YjhB (NUDIX family)